MRGYKGESYMDCGLFCVSPITGTLQYYPPYSPSNTDAEIVESKVIKGFAQYRKIDEPFEASKKEDIEDGPIV